MDGSQRKRRQYQTADRVELRNLNRRVKVSPTSSQRWSFVNYTPATSNSNSTSESMHMHLPSTTFTLLATYLPKQITSTNFLNLQAECTRSCPLSESFLEGRRPQTDRALMQPQQAQGKKTTQRHV
ncbi:hypothetical protein HYFRA_00003278 [Hymenoscyphus fraxineus]|uniref:Uncharacterized protein n=1 Tax=Hymenoscyphus fraxineus TaxID=746836 RepID=A0A9N9KUX0_9HELO|nr:hypothetical protein HYFRA_00003278 [Hymenoscyphus fraxineus]